VLVVDDSAFARKVVREVLSANLDVEVVGIARDGLEALEQIQALRPDVVTLDLMMPNLDGLGVLRALPTVGSPRVVVVSTTDVDGALALEALSAGAVDFVHKPTALPTDRLYELSDELVAKVLVAATARAPDTTPATRGGVAALARPAATATNVVVVGTSTGGPQALTRLLAALPANFPAPIAIALHIPPGYTGPLAQRLDAGSALTVVEADHEIALRPGLVVLARGGTHLEIGSRDGALVARTSQRQTSSPFAPSVDVLFESAAEAVGSGVLGVVLTGMGNDGLEGARRIRAAGGRVIVESRSSCVVYGMPRCVEEAGLANDEAALPDLPGLLTRRV
jgi:two-component system chemotaxis response regulator CheB